MTKRTFEVTLFDELDGNHEMLTITANTVDEAIHAVESNTHHQYEIIEIEEIKTYGELL